MATPSNKSPQMTDFLENMFGRSTHIENDTCVICNGEAKTFRNDISQKEYTISGMCQSCQDKTFDTD